MLDLILDYLIESSAITMIVLLSLSIYFILVMWIFFYKNSQLQNSIIIEKEALDSLKKSYTINPISKFAQAINDGPISREFLKSYEISFIKDFSSGLSWLSIISSTAPFIGLFGTVVGILESFAAFSTHSKVSFSIIAPAISEALIATAAGIFVAIFAYTFHQIITRKVYEIESYLRSQSEFILSRK